MFLGWKFVIIDRHKNTQILRREEPPDFLAQLDTENRDVKTELSELQAINNNNGNNNNNNLHNNDN